jgi:type IV secretion system protein VirB6
MAAACQTLAEAGVIRGVLATVDCQTRTYAELGYSALTAGNGVFQAALTALLTIYIAVAGYRLMFAQGAARLSDAPGIALKVGVILALVTSWPTFQTLVFDLAHRAPLEVAGLAAAPLQGDRQSLAAAPVAGLQAAYDELTQSAIAFGKAAGPTARAYSDLKATTSNTLSTAAGALFVMSAGVISAATLAIGVLTAVGPVFLAMFLIPATRGLFVGWVRALIAAALIPLVGWLLLTLLLSVAEPWLVRLAEQRRLLELDPQTGLTTASLVFVFGFAQAALVLGACVVAFGFRLPRLGGAPRPATAAAAGTAQAPVVLQPTRAERLAMDLQRDAGQAQARARSLQAAAQAPAQARMAAAAQAPAQAPRLGDAYRRPAVQARRTGGGR